jgi:type IX secretion system PorP/SprF family membrane protein
VNIRSLFLLLIIYSPFFYGQDIHWSIPTQNPIEINPSNIGNFNGDVRIISNYKDQWRSVTKPFSTINLNIDKKFNDRFSLGSKIMHDVTGDGKYRTIEFCILPSITFYTKNKIKFTAGLSLGINYKQISPSNFKFDNQFDGYMFQEFLSSNEVFQTNSKLNFNSAAGIQLIVNQHTIDCSLHNLNQPDQSFFASKIKRPLRLLLGYQTQLNRNGLIQYTPSMIYQQQNAYSELITGIKGSYQMNQKKLKSISLGLNIRYKDAMTPYLGFEFNSLNLGIGYDINTSTLNLASNYRGGTEFYLNYIFIKPPIKNLEHRKCKDFL